MNLLKLVKIYNGSMTPHRSDTSGVRRVKEGNTCRTHKVDYQKTGGTVRWTGITCATCTTRWPMARQHSKRDMARHSTDHQSPSEHWLSTSQLHRFSWLGTSWFATQTLGLLISACLSSKSRPWHVLLWTDPCCVAASSARFKCAGSGCLSFLVSSFSKNMIFVVCFHFLTCSVLVLRKQHGIQNETLAGACWDTLENWTFEWIPDPRVLIGEILI